MEPFASRVRHRTSNSRYITQYFRDISISISRMYSGYLDTHTCDISHYIDTILHANNHHKYIVRRYDVFFRSGRDLSLKHKHQYTNWRPKAPRSLRAAFYTGKLHECTAVWCKGAPGRKFKCEHLFFSRIWNEGTLGRGEGRGLRAMWPRIWVTKGSELDKVMRKNYA